MQPVKRTLPRLRGARPWAANTPPLYNATLRLLDKGASDAEQLARLTDALTGEEFMQVRACASCSQPGSAVSQKGQGLRPATTHAMCDACAPAR